MTGLSARIDTPERTVSLELPLPGLYNLYNALGAIATARQLGISPSDSVAALAGMKAVFGRMEKISIGATDLSILLIKNPAGANEVLRTLALEPAPIPIWIALNDRIADGRDVSWIWDADFETLAESAGPVICTGTRAPEMALRLKYAGWPVDSIRIESGAARALDLALAGNPASLYALPTYTALLELRRLLADRGVAGHYWDA